LEAKDPQLTDKEKALLHEVWECPQVLTDEGAFKHLDELGLARISKVVYYELTERGLELVDKSADLFFEAWRRSYGLEDK
jgi:hypothetical protein